MYAIVKAGGRQDHGHRLIDGVINLKGQQDGT